MVQEGRAPCTCIVTVRRTRPPTASLSLSSLHFFPKVQSLRGSVARRLFPQDSPKCTCVNSPYPGPPRPMGTRPACE